MTVKAHCDDCEEAQLITPTGIKQGNNPLMSSTWWRLVQHKNKKTGDFCEGSGKLV